MSQKEESEKPKRIQRKRTKGWRMPANTIYVGRPSKWGNPYALKNAQYSRHDAVLSYRIWLSAMIRDNSHFLDELKGKDLACWCPLNVECHANVLLERVNPKTT